MTPRRYLRVFAATFLGLGVFTVVANYLIDPYLFFGTPRIDGVSEFKNDINDYVRLSKAYHPAGRKWDRLLVGNSRIEMGLDPSHACFRQARARVYNLGIPGAGVRTQLEYALNLIYQDAVKHVYLSVDLVDFLVAEGQDRPASPPDWTSASGSLRFAFDGSPNPGHGWTSFMDHYRALFSLDALSSSTRTMLLQSAHGPDRDEFGFNPARDFAAAVRIEGPSALFAQKMAVLEKKYNRPLALTYRDGTVVREFGVLLQFLEIAAAKGIEVTIFTNPFHQEFWDLLKENDLFGLQREWLERLIERLQAADFPGVRVWDFSADSPYIHEPVPNAGKRNGPLRWFWEPAHYRKELGDLMLDAMLGDECQTERRFGALVYQSAVISEGVDPGARAVR